MLLQVVYVKLKNPGQLTGQGYFESVVVSRSITDSRKSHVSELVNVSASQSKIPHRQSEPAMSKSGGEPIIFGQRISSRYIIG